MPWILDESTVGPKVSWRKWRVIVRKAEKMPHGFGVSYYRPACGDGVCHRKPLNIVVRAVYLIWLWSMYPFKGWEPRWWKRKHL